MSFKAGIKLSELRIKYLMQHHNHWIGRKVLCIIPARENSWEGSTDFLTLSAKVDDFELGTWISLIRILGIYKTHTKCCPLAVPLSTNLFDSCIHCEKKFACNKVSYWNWISEMWKPSQTRKVPERGERVIGVLKVFTYTFKVAKHH